MKVGVGDANRIGSKGWRKMMLGGVKPTAGAVGVGVGVNVAVGGTAVCVAVGGTGVGVQVGGT